MRHSSVHRTAYSAVTRQILCKNHACLKVNFKLYGEKWRKSSPTFPPKEKRIMQRMKWFAVLALVLATGNLSARVGQQPNDRTPLAPLDAQREKYALQSFLKIAERMIIPAVEAMPADKFAFAPTDGEFKGVRTFGQMVKHLSATNHILAAAALGEE